MVAIATPLPATLRRAERAERARNGRWAIREISPGCFEVTNLDNGGHRYTVSCLPTTGDWTCTCPDFRHRHGTCKHILAVWLHGPVMAVAEDGERVLAGRPSRAARIVPISLFGASGDGDPTSKAPQTHNTGGTDMNGQYPRQPMQQVRPQGQVGPLRPQTSAQPQLQRLQSPAQPPRPQTPPRWAQREYQHGDELLSSYPFIQWVNRGDMLEPRQARGGFACPLSQKLPIPDSIYAVLHHPEGNTTDVYYTDHLTVAVLRTRDAWVDPKTRMRLPGYMPDARKKLQVLCYLKTDEGAHGLIMLTFIGLAGSRFKAARQDFINAVRKATNGKAPGYAFWMTVLASDPELVGKGNNKSPITPVTWDGDFDPDRDYIGDEALDGIDWAEVERWANAWKTPGPNGEGEVETGPEPEEEEIPF